MNISCTMENGRAGFDESQKEVRGKSVELSFTLLGKQNKEARVSTQTATQNRKYTVRSTTTSNWERRNFFLFLQNRRRRSSSSSPAWTARAPRTPVRLKPSFSSDVRSPSTAWEPEDLEVHHMVPPVVRRPAIALFCVTVLFPSNCCRDKKPSRATHGCFQSVPPEGFQWPQAQPFGSTE